MVHMTIILAIRRLRQEDREFKASLVRKEVGRKGEREGRTEGRRENGGKASYVIQVRGKWRQEDHIFKVITSYR